MDSSSQFQYFPADRLVRPPRNVLSVFRRHESRPAQRRRAQPDARRLFRHQHRGQDSLDGAAQRDDAVVFHEDNARGTANIAEKFSRLLADGLGQLQTGIGVGDENRRDIAANNFVWKNSLFGELTRAVSTGSN